jgi:hypothetical protein
MTFRRGFGVYNDNVHTPPLLAICRFPTSSVLLTPVLHLTPGWPTTYTSYREIAYRDFAMSDVRSSCHKSRSSKLRYHLSSMVGKKRLPSILSVWYHNGYLWLNYPVNITGGLIHKITGISHGGMPIPKTTNTNEWIQILIGGTMAKNSKGILINKVIDPYAKWIFIIISLCFTVHSRASDVKLTMLEPIGQILDSRAQFDWEECLATLIQSNC